MWMVKCKLGSERETTLMLMRKFLAHMDSPDPIAVKSVVAPEGARGYIYVEAFKQAHVKRLIEDVSNLRLGQWSQLVSDEQCIIMSRERRIR